MRATLLPGGERSSQQAIFLESPRAIEDKPTLQAEAASPEVRRRARIDGYDWVRLLAAINVIFFHVSPSPTGFLGRGGVPAFLMIAASIPAMRHQIEPFAPFALRRAHRILVPWLFWSAVFGLVAGTGICTAASCRNGRSTIC